VLLNYVGEMIAERWIVISNPRELILDEDLGKTNVGVTILRCENDKTQIMSIWRWPLSQIVLDGHCLLSLLTTYDEHHESEDDEEIVGVKKNAHICEKKSKNIK
jgi:hypothetical protein